MIKHKLLLLCYHSYPYAAVAELIYGKYMRIFVTILLDMTVFGAGIPNLLVGKPKNCWVSTFRHCSYNFNFLSAASQNLQLLGHRISNGNFYFSFCYWLILIGLFMCPIMWLGSPKNMKYAIKFLFIVLIETIFFQNSSQCVGCYLFSRCNFYIDLHCFRWDRWC